MSFAEEPDGGDGTPGADADTAPPGAGRRIRWYGWLDRHGVTRHADIYVDDDDPDQRIRVYAPPEAGTRQLLATMTGNGRFYRMGDDHAHAYGLQTSAAWNDLYEVCRNLRHLYPPRSA